MSRKRTVSKPGAQPPHREVMALQREIGAALERSPRSEHAARILQVLAEDHLDDAEGLQGLLHDLAVTSPTDLLELLRLLTMSSSYAALTWARGLTTPSGEHFDREQTRQASWVLVANADEDADDEVSPVPPSDGQLR